MPRPTRLFAVPLLLLLAAPLEAATPVPIPDGPNTALPNDPLNQDRAKFSMSTFDDGTGRAFYFSSQNNRILVNYQNPNGTWRYNPSRVAIEIPETPSNASVTIALGVVLASATSDYKNPIDNQFYKRLMYFIYQGSSNSSAGGVCAAFSNDGITWANPTVRVGLAGAPVVACDDPSNAPTKLESVAAVRVGSALWVAGLEGDLDVLAFYASSARTLTYLYTANPLTPHVLAKQGEITPAGMSTPTGPGGAHDYYFRNLDFSYDPVTDKAVLLRVTPYGYYLTSQGVCLGVCPSGLGTFPMRGQMYSMVIGGNPSTMLTGTWALVFDWGRSVGWPRKQANGQCSPPIATDGVTQANIGIDLDSLNIHKQTSGIVARSSGLATFYMGGFLNRRQSCENHLTPADTFLDASLYTQDLAF